jgi:uncharacterized damage-inducible protein DinB
MLVEPWLRGPLPGVHPLVAPTLHAYAQAREDLDHWTEGLSDSQIWVRPQGLAPVGFQLRHIAGSVERLTTYLRAEQLTPSQLEALHLEMEPGPGRATLLHQAHQALDNSEQFIRTLAPGTLSDPRTVGRQKLPTTVIGLVVHLAEHTQRHVGQLIVTCRLLRTASNDATS